MAKAEKLASSFHRTKAIALDASSLSELDKHVSTYDVVISLVPYIFHVNVIKAAIKGKTQVVTTSYISEAIRGLDIHAKEAGITVLNEVGGTEAFLFADTASSEL